MMAHKMGLAQFTLADKDIFTSKKYLDKSGRTYSYVWVEDSTLLKAHSSRTFSTTPKPYSHNTATKYYIVKKATNTTFTAADENQYPNGDVPNNGWSEPNVNIAGGQCKIVTKTPAITCSVFSQHTLQVGDIFYSDGALSASHTGSKHKTPIGIVFYKGTTDYDKSVNAQFTHGYVMALKYAGGTHSAPVTWCTGTWQTSVATDGLLTPRSGTGLGKDGCDIITPEISGDAQMNFRISAIRNDMEGLKHCKYALQNSSTAMTAILKAQSHQSYAPVPTSSTNVTAGTITLQSPITSGWYLPSIGQCYQWMNACSTTITGSESVGYRENPTGDLTKDFYINKAISMPTVSESTACAHVCNQITNFLNGKGLTGFYSYLYETAKFWWWTSTENFADHMFVFNCDGTTIYMDGRRGYAPKDGSGDINSRAGVMPVLVF